MLLIRFMGCAKSLISYEGREGKGRKRGALKEKSLYRAKPELTISYRTTEEPEKKDLERGLRSFLKLTRSSA